MKRKKEQNTRCWGRVSTADTANTPGNAGRQECPKYIDVLKNKDAHKLVQIVQYILMKTLVFLELRSLQTKFECQMHEEVRQLRSQITQFKGPVIIIIIIKFTALKDKKYYIIKDKNILSYFIIVTATK